MVPLGIITAAIGLAGLGMSGVHYLFTGEVRDISQTPPSVAPTAPNKQHSVSSVHDQPNPPSPSSRAYAGYSCTRCDSSLPCPASHHPDFESTLRRRRSSLVLPSPDAIPRVWFAQRNKPMTDRWKEALYDRDRMIKVHYPTA